MRLLILMIALLVVGITTGQPTESSYTGPWIGPPELDERLLRVFFKEGFRREIMDQYRTQRRGYVCDFLLLLLLLIIKPDRKSVTISSHEKLSI